jgi:hypothetical protein
MRSVLCVALVAILACAAVAYRRGNVASPAQQPTPPARAAADAQETPQQINDRFTKQLSQAIAGHENEPASKVFKNIQIEWLKDSPAGRFLRIMNGGYSRALGVACTHCHVADDFASDEKRPKLAAREMAVMHHMINQQLRKMQNLQSKAETRAINCSTCHRGAINPMASDR